MNAREGLPVVADPGVVSPAHFVREALTERFPNPFLPDTPQRIATDTSQKLSIRFDETIKADGENIGTLRFIPFVFAGWLRYLLIVDDDGHPFSPSSVPLLSVLQRQPTQRKIYIG